MVQKLGWKPLEDRRTGARLTTIYKETHGLIPNNIDRFTHKGCHQTRRLHGKFSYETPKFSKDCLEYSLYHRTIPEWNLLPDCVKTAPNLDKFKAVLSNMDVCIVWSTKLTSKFNYCCHKCLWPLYRDSPPGRCVQYRTRTRSTS